MEWVTVDSLKTVGGASAAVTLVTAAIKSISLKIAGRVTQAIALGLSLVIAGVLGKWSSASDCLVTILNGFVIFTSAVGIDQVINYNRSGKVRSKPPRNSDLSDSEPLVAGTK